MLNYEDAVNKISEQISLLKKDFEEIDLVDSLGRILAEDVISDVNLPPFTNSAMDGYAVKYSTDIRSWEIVAEISAGNFSDVKIDERTAVRIMTGAKLPEGADTVIPIEDCIQSERVFTIPDDIILKKFRNTRIMGEDLKVNSHALKAGTLMKKN